MVVLTVQMNNVHNVSYVVSFLSAPLPSTLIMNDLAKRRNRTLKKMLRGMISLFTLPESF